MRASGRAIILAFATVGVGSAVVAGLIAVGTPGRERMRRLDERRVSDLNVIHTALTHYVSKHASLPATLDQLQDSPETTVNTHDPVTSRPYGYSIVEGKTYELCADFQRESVEASSNPSD